MTLAARAKSVAPRSPEALRKRLQKQAETPLTLASLQRSALWHLGRRALTAAELRQRLQKKAKRHPPTDSSAAWIDDVVARMTTSLLVDDVAVARARVASGRARGLSKRRIAQKLHVDADVAADAFASSDVDDLAAARVFVEKKRLKQKEPQKALAALARQGFSYDVAKKALAPDPD